MCASIMFRTSSATFRYVSRSIKLNLADDIFSSATRLYSSKTSRLDSKAQYEYIDSGDQMRLERFGPYIVRRSCPSAIWPRNTNIDEWSIAANGENNILEYIGSSGRVGSWSELNAKSGDSPEMSLEADSKVSKDWQVSFSKNMVFNLQTSDYGQIGIFPEQQPNWTWIQKMCREYMSARGDPATIESSSASKSAAASSGVSPTFAPPPTSMRILNGFAYTGGSSLAAAAVDGVQVCPFLN